MRTVLISALLAMSCASAFADDDAAYNKCFTSEEDPTWTLTEGVTNVGAGLLWKRGQAQTFLTSGAIGTGIMARSATEPDGTTHAYLYVGDTLVFDMVPYEAGCK